MNIYTSLHLYAKNIRKQKSNEEAGRENRKKKSQREEVNMQIFPMKKNINLKISAKIKKIPHKMLFLSTLTAEYVNNFHMLKDSQL